MHSQYIALFGEAERGKFRTLYRLSSLDELDHHLGQPPKDTHGLHMAVQALLFRYPLFFIRVREEGFSYPDYYYGLKLLQAEERSLSALCVPGVGDSDLIRISSDLCKEVDGILVTSEKDLYDYLSG